MMFVLKRLSAAEAAGDKIHCVIRACASSSDGKAPGIYAPTIAGQEQAIRRACVTEKRINVVVVVVVVVGVVVVVDVVVVFVGVVVGGSGVVLALTAVAMAAEVSVVVVGWWLAFDGD